MDPHEFEDDVRRTARALWPRPGNGGAEIVDGRERDCIFDLEDITHYIEATTSRTLEKVKKDVSKMVAYREKGIRVGKLVKLWIVTEQEPTADQRSHCRTYSVEILSLYQFQRKLIDGQLYLDLRKKYAFGSARHPKTEADDLTEVQYQPTAIRKTSGGESMGIADLSVALAKGNRFVLLGDFGMGKSIAIREVFRRLSEMYECRQTDFLPVAINLRDHWGQTAPAEALDRHATRIGFSRSDQLVRAFNAGRLILLLDGFDEIVSMPWSKAPVSVLKVLRKRALELVRGFYRRGTSGGGVLVAGREHFFDDSSEMSEALDLKPSDEILALDEFSDSEVKAYLQTCRVTQELPDWLPRRPLLVANLVANGLLEAVAAAGEKKEPASAWNQLVTAICAREARIHDLLDGEAIRRILERVASKARATPTGLGPVSEEDIAAAFLSETSARPDETARVLLQRLPGLSRREQQLGTRMFLDDQMLDVLRAGDVAKFVDAPYSFDPRAGDWRHGLGLLGAAAAIERLQVVAPQRKGDSASGGTKCTGQLVTASRVAMERKAAPTLAMDIVHVARAACAEEPHVDFGGLMIEGADVDSLELDESPVPVGLRLVDCMLEELTLPTRAIESFGLLECMINRIYGCGDASALPKWVDRCEVTEFDIYGTSAAVFNSRQVAPQLMVLVSLLRKLFLQKGHGRMESALNRGMDQSLKTFVPDIIQILAAKGMIYCFQSQGKRIWHPISGHGARVRKIVMNPNQFEDPLVSAVLAL